MTVFVSAGHGPRPTGVFDPGVVWEGFGEHSEALAWRDEVAHAAQLLGLPVSVVPEVTLPEKVAFINARCAQLGPSLAIELHFNAASGPGPRGCETLYAPRSSRGMVFAELVQTALDPLFPSSSGISRGVKEAWYRMDHPHVVDYPGDVDGDEVPDYFCVRTLCPAIICEPEFIYERASIQGKREAACQEIARALMKAHPLLAH